MAAGPYFQNRFHSSHWILTHFQSSILTVSTLGNLTSVLILTRIPPSLFAYPTRILVSLLASIAAFTYLAVSTGDGLGSKAYFGVVLGMVGLTSVATGLMQNEVFAFVGGWGRGEYVQGIMVGQAVAGVLPSIARRLPPPYYPLPLQSC